MADINPYQAPQASVADAPGATGALRAEPRAVDAGRGAGWLKDGFTIFRQAPLIWVAMAVIALVLIMIVGLIPVLGQIANPLLGVLLGGGFMLACRAVDRGDELSVGHLFQGFQSHASPLLVVGALYIVGLLIIVVGVSIVGLGSAMTLFQMGEGQPPAGAGPAVLLLVLLVVGLSVPLVMAVWFAPALVTLSDVPPVEAMKMSFRGCLRNIVPFLVYGVIGFVLSILATIPLMLGWLVLGPVLAGSMYAAYVDVFIDSDAS